MSYLHLHQIIIIQDLVFIRNPLEEEQTAAGKYTDEVIKRLLYLRKLDGFPVIREVEEEETEEVSGTLDLQEIDRMAQDDDDEDDNTKAPTDTEDN